MQTWKVSDGKKEKTKFIRLINACAVLGLTLWYLFPPFTNRPELWVIFCFVWACTVVLSNKEMTITKKNLNRYIYLGIWVAYELMVVFQVGNDSGYIGEAKGFLLSLACVEVFRYYYEKKDYKMLRRIAIFAICIYILTLARAFFIAGDNSSIYRLSNNTGINNESVGNFGTYYAAVYMIPTGIKLAFQKRLNIKLRLIGLTLLVVCVQVLYYAQYSIAIITTVFTLGVWIFLNLCRKNLMIWLGVLILSSVPIYTLLYEITGNWLLSVSSSLPLVVSSKAIDLAYFLLGNQSNEGETAHRLGLYAESLANIFINPILGGWFANFIGVSNIQFRGHNSLFYIFEAYGIPVGICFYYFWVPLCRNFVKSLKQASDFRYCLAVSLGYIFLSCLNPTFNIYTLTWVMLFGVYSSVYIGNFKEGGKSYEKKNK